MTLPPRLYAAPLRRVICALMLALTTSACGTALYEHRIEVAVRDASGQPMSRAVEVSVFDSLMGSSDEWARRTAGPSSASAPYVGRVTATATRTVMESSLPDIRAGLAIPEFSTQGYFALQLQPQPGAEQMVELPFAAYNPDVPLTVKVAPLPGRMTAEALEKGWLIKLTVTMPAGPPPPGD